MGKIRVMVVEDSAFMRKALKELLESTGKIEVVELAKNGKEAVELSSKQNIDVITMDVEMPVMDGITATKEIMKQNPLPIVMLSSLTANGAEETIKSLEAGAVDFIEKPSGSVSLDINKIKDEISKKITGASLSKYSRTRKKIDVRDIVYAKPGKKTKPKILIIGSSTGGPQALQNIIPKLMPMGLPVVIIQHMPPGFTKSMAKSLDLKSVLTVKEAEFGEELKPDFVYVAPGGTKHLTIENKIGKNYFRAVDNEIAGKFYMPSVDIMLLSAAKTYGDKILAVILTGMGNDGLIGFKEIKANGAYAIAESNETAVVYGMPRVVVEGGLADEVLPLHKIAESISKYVLG